jgi:hypothetical protein
MIGVRGIFAAIEAFQKDANGQVIESSRRQLTGEFENLILDNGLELMKSTDFLGYICVGSGSTAPAVTDTALKTFIAAKNTSVSTGPHDFTPTDYPWTSAKVTCEFDKGAAAGNLSEIGVGKYASSLLCRSLIKDEAGNPDTITVTADEYLGITYYWRVYSDLTYRKTDTFVIDGVTYTTVSMVARVNPMQAELWNEDGPFTKTEYNYLRIASYGGPIGDPGSPPAGTNNASASAYINLNDDVAGHAVETVASIGLDDLNQQNITALLMSAYSTYYVNEVKCSISPPLTKTSDYTGTIAFKLSWGRYTP